MMPNIIEIHSGDEGCIFPTNRSHIPFKRSFYSLCR